MFCPSNWNAIMRDGCSETTPGGIIIPDKAKASHAPFRGTVSLAGIENKHIKQGDVVRFDRTGAFTETINGAEYAFVKEESIIMVENRDHGTIEIEGDGK
jgi:co-chaperonin GroES (HSP10)